MKGLKKIFQLENLQLLVFIYACIKHARKSEFKWINLILNSILSFLVTNVLYLVAFVLILYYELVNLILRLKHGENFFGIMEGSDVIWGFEDETNSIINSMMLMDIKEGDSYEDLYNFLSENYLKLSKTHPKMGAVRKNFMGYCYYLRKSVNVKDYVKFMEDYRNEDELKVLLDKYSNSPLPLGNSASWEIFVGKTPIEWKRNCKNKLYPLFIKYHHSLGDGIAIVAMMTTNLIENGEEIMKEKCQVYKSIIEKIKAKKKSNKKSFVKVVKALWDKEYYVKYFGPIDGKSENLLNGKKLTSEKWLCWALEEENKNYVDKVKLIKNRFVGISFSDVILSAISASFAEYYMKHDQNPPETVRNALTYFITSSDYNKIITMKDGNPVAKLKNNFSIGMVDVPIRDKNIEENVIQRLKLVNEDTNRLKKSLDYPFIFWQLKLSSIIPLPILRFSADSNSSTIAITNVPGNKTSRILCGHVIRDTIIWAPNFLKMGVTFSIFTYDDMFRFGLLVDKTLIDNRKDAQGICDRVFHYIDQMELKSRSSEKHVN